MPRKGERAEPPTDLLGKRFGYLTVLAFSHRDNNSKQYWKCYCEKCGNETITSRWYLLSNTTSIKACGCMQGKNISYLTSNKSYNKYDFSNKDYITGYTTKGESFLIDYDDYELVKTYTWHFGSNGYVCTTVYSAEKPIYIRMHRLVMGLQNVEDKGQIVDHINHNKSDNRKNNLRIVTNSQNQMNCSPRKHSSPCTGVSWHKVRQKWIAQIQINKELKYLGIYDNLEDAIRARKEAEQKYFKEYAYNPV